MSRIPRDAIVEALHRALEDAPYVVAAVLGGSEATGRTDRFSDVDLVAVVDDDRVEEGMALVLSTMEALSPIAHSHRLPEPTWHGHAQVFLALAEADPHHLVDAVVMKRTAPDKLLERERHGIARILFDPEGLMEPVPVDRAKLRPKMQARLKTLRETFSMFQVLTIRAVERGSLAEAMHWYQALSLRPLVDVFRLRHCPDRFDFGMRYLDRDLPAPLRQEVERLSFPGDPDTLERFRQRAAARVEEELAAYERGEWSLP